VKCDFVDVICDFFFWFEPVDGALMLPGRDFTLENTQQEIVKLLSGRNVDLVLSDMAPNVSGNSDADHECITNLVYSVIKFGLNNLAVNGDQLVKMFNGRNVPIMIKDLQKYFKMVQIVKPSSSRKESSEIFILSKSFVGIKK